LNYGASLSSINLFLRHETQQKAGEPLITPDIEAVATAAETAAERIGQRVLQTPLPRSQYFSKLAGADVFLKLENRQHTGSFKIRGAMNCLLSLSAEQRNRGCVAASSGNHGAAVAYAMRALAMHGCIFVPEQTSAAKLDAIRDYGGEVRFFGTDGLDTEQHARDYARREGLYYVSPYNDAAVIAGQGTCGVELMQQLPALDAVVIAVGGGGLLSGVASVVKTRNPQAKVIAAQPRASAVMARSIEAGRILDLASEPTLSDGTAGGIEPGSITFELCRALVDEFLLVDERDIGAAMNDFHRHEGAVIEGAAGVAIAALRQSEDSIRGKNVAVIICGGNVAATVLAELGVEPSPLSDH
jgi:threonine dehydratase